MERKQAEAAAGVVPAEEAVAPAVAVDSDAPAAAIPLTSDPQPIDATVCRSASMRATF